MTGEENIQHPLEYDEVDYTLDEIIAEIEVEQCELFKILLEDGDIVVGRVVPLTAIARDDAGFLTVHGLRGILHSEPVVGIFVTESDPFYLKMFFEGWPSETYKCNTDVWEYIVKRAMAFRERHQKTNWQQEGF